MAALYGQGGHTTPPPLSCLSGLSAVGWPDKVCQHGGGVLGSFLGRALPLAGLGWTWETGGCEAGGCEDALREQAAREFLIHRAKATHKCRHTWLSATISPREKLGGLWEWGLQR